MRGNFAVFPPRGAPVSAASLAREMAAVARVTISPPPFPEDAARGNGQPVIVLPGFGAKDFTTAHLRAFLAAQGFAPRPWPCGTNIGPARNVLMRVEREVNEMAGRRGKVALVGISLGGTIAREIARRRPAQISRVITLGSPVRLPVVSPLAPLAQAASLLWDADGRASLSRILEKLAVPLTAIISPIDGIVDWECCRPEPGDGEVIEVRTGHTIMGSTPEVQRIVAARLALD
jgi:pimeloyl-ACP methyl ester carboxylesterase